MAAGNGKVPMFRMRPQIGTLVLAGFVLLLGLLLFLEGHRDPGDIPAHERSTFILVVSVVLAGLLAIISTSRMWFKHLWHDRYR